MNTSWTHKLEALADECARTHKLHGNRESTLAHLKPLVSPGVFGMVRTQFHKLILPRQEDATAVGSCHKCDSAVCPSQIVCCRECKRSWHLYCVEEHEDRWLHHKPPLWFCKEHRPRIAGNPLSRSQAHRLTFALPAAATTGKFSGHDTIHWGPSYGFQHAQGDLAIREQDGIFQWVDTPI